MVKQIIYINIIIYLIYMKNSLHETYLLLLPTCDQPKCLRARFTQLFSITSACLPTGETY